MNKEYRDIIDNIFLLAKGLGTINIMEVCGTHTASIYRYGIASILPKNIELISGPGCPVCVTSSSEIEQVISLLYNPKVTVCCFGDMLRVPASGNSLYRMREKGFDVRIVASPLDAFSIAQANPDRDIVFFAVGFETTAPLTAVLLEYAKENSMNNLFVYSSHKTMPEPIRKLFSDGSEINGLLCPGHVATIIGKNAFQFIPKELNMPAVIAGFKIQDILIGIFYILKMLKENKPDCINAYPAFVGDFGNREALYRIEKVFEPCFSYWRGLGNIANSGLNINADFAEFDAREYFNIQTVNNNHDTKGCICGEILTGRMKPNDCKLFGNKCTPQSPVGACMVSHEGNCASYYKYNI